MVKNYSPNHAWATTHVFLQVFHWTEHTVWSNCSFILTSYTINNNLALLQTYRQLQQLFQIILPHMLLRAITCSSLKKIKEPFKTPPSSVLF